jgi:hypothetical protein
MKDEERDLPLSNSVGTSGVLETPNLLKSASQTNTTYVIEKGAKATIIENHYHGDIRAQEFNQKVTTNNQNWKVSLKVKLHSFIDKLFNTSTL